MIELILVGFSTVLSTLALWVSLAKLAVRWPRRRFDELELEVGDIAHQVNSLAASHKRLNSRVGMREARAKAADERADEGAGERAGGGNGIGTAMTRQRPGETPEEWKARMRLMLKTGALNG